LFDGASPFDTAKPVKLVRRLLELFTQNEGIILDFFAGSGTTAHSVLELNRHDGGRRHFVMVQLPEPTDNAEYSSIAEIGEERIRRVIAKLQEDTKGTLAFSDGNTPEDLGFKVFKLAKPNIQQWTPDAERDPEAYAQKLAIFNDPLVSGWTPENVLWEVALREGFSLNTRFEKKSLGNGNTIYEVSDPDSGQQLAVCLDEEIKADLSKHYELTNEHLFVCRDIALDDTAAANLALQCRLKTI
jgi:adenine-specific DNA-methyltransferase